MNESSGPGGHYLKEPSWGRLFPGSAIYYVMIETEVPKLAFVFLVFFGACLSLRFLS